MKEWREAPCNYNINITHMCKIILNLYEYFKCFLSRKKKSIYHFSKELNSEPTALSGIFHDLYNIYFFLFF